MKPGPHDARHLDVTHLARDSARLSGEWPLDGFPRLLIDARPAPGMPPIVHWSAQGEARTDVGGAPQVWLHLDAEAAVQVTCQRCLQPMAVRLEVHTPFRFVGDEAQAEREDESSDEDVLVLGAALDLHELLEDELILALPLVPRHEHCDLPLPASSAAGEAGPNPFAALDKLRRGQGGQG